MFLSKLAVVNYHACANNQDGNEAVAVIEVVPIEE